RRIERERVDRLVNQADRGADDAVGRLGTRQRSAGAPALRREERRVHDGLKGPLFVEMKRVAKDDRLLEQLTRFVFGAVRIIVIFWENRGIGQIRRPENWGVHARVIILAVEETVRTDRHVVHEAENIDMAVERGLVADDRKMR